MQSLCDSFSAGEAGDGDGDGGDGDGRPELFLTSKDIKKKKSSPGMEDSRIFLGKMVSTLYLDGILPAGFMLAVSFRECCHFSQSESALSSQKSPKVVFFFTSSWFSLVANIITRGKRTDDILEWAELPRIGS